MEAYSLVKCSAVVYMYDHVCSWLIDAVHMIESLMRMLRYVEAETQEQG